MSALKVVKPVVVEDSQALALAGDARQILTETAAITIINHEQYANAGEVLKEIKGKFKGLEERRVYLKAPALEQCRRIDEWFKGPLQFLKDAENAIKKALVAYSQEQQKRELEARREAEAKARLERERIRKEAEALAAKADLTVGELMRRSADAEARGDDKEASRLLAKAEQIAETAEVQVALKEDRAGEVVPVVATLVSTPKIAGQSMRKLWRYRILDVSQIPREYLVPNEKLLAMIAKSTEGKQAIPGIEFYAEDSLSSTSY